MIGETLAHYEIGPMLGKGGMGEVYRARDTKLDREVAIKLLPPELDTDAERLARFRREAKVLASLNHPNIAAIYGLEEDRGRHFLVMELAEGEDLSRRIRSGPVPLDDALAFARQIAEGLEEAHEKGIVHRDLKPANVMVSDEGRIRILDFGLARAFVGEAGEEGDPGMSPTITAALTQAGVVLGSAAYMSPEQAKGRGVDRRTDIWAFGVVLWEMITGKSLFGAETISESMASVLKEPIAWDALPADLPPGIRALLERCLERDPRLRLRDIGEARIHLQDPQASGVFGTAFGSSPSLAAPVGPPRWRSTLPWALVAVVGVALVAVMAGVGRPSRQEAPAAAVVRSSLEAPPGTGFHLTGANPAAMAISPDGTRVVFGARDDKGVAQLWLQDLAHDAAEPITGTETAQYPFWSPDGGSVAFFAGGMLRVIDLVAGSNRPLTAASDGKGGCWLDDGTIVYTPTAGAGLWRVPAAGGEPQAVTNLDSEPRSNSHRLPRALPGARHVLYAARSTDEGVAEAVFVMAADLDGGGTRVLLNADGQAEYADGHLLYMIGGNLFARPFDPLTLEFDGAPVVLAGDVGSIPGAALALFSASSAGRLIYHPGHSETLRSRLVWIDLKGERQGELGEARGYGKFSISPDGRRVVFTAYDSRSGSGDLWLHDLTSDVRSRLTFESADESGPVWSPDGTTVYYVWNAANALTEIRAIRPESREDPRTVLRYADLTAITDVSPDGTQLAIAIRDSATSAIWACVVPVDGSAPPQPIDPAAGNTAALSFSPDGRWLVYASREDGSWKLYLRTYPLTGRKWQLSNREALWFDWAPRGDRIYSQSTASELSVTELDVSGPTPQIGQTSVVVSDFPTPLTNLHKFEITPDGQRFLVSDAGGGEHDRPARLLQGWTTLATAGAAGR